MEYSGSDLVTHLQVSRACSGISTHNLSARKDDSLSDSGEAAINTNGKKNPTPQCWPSIPGFPGHNQNRVRLWLTIPARDKRIGGIAYGDDIGSRWSR